MRKTARLRRNVHVFQFSIDKRAEFLDNIRPYGWSDYPYTVLDITVVGPSGNEVELYDGEYFVIFEDGKNVFDWAEPYDQLDFDARFVFN